MSNKGARCALHAGLSLCFAMLVAGPATAGDAAQGRHADFGSEQASDDARRLADWVVTSGDAHGLPFVIVDKKEARVFAFDPLGRLRSAAPALLGLARGDRSTPGIGTRRLADIPPAHRITPAGRFEAALGKNLAGKDILWVDYADAISLHRVITTNAREQRLQRLATPSIDDNRISYGCINVPVSFYENAIRPLFMTTNGTVYVMPETTPLEEVFSISGTPIAGSSPVDLSGYPIMGSVQPCLNERRL